MKHAFRKGLMQPRKGEANNKTKITEDDVREIRRLRAETDKTLHEIGSMFGISYGSVHQIVKKQTWKDVI